MPTTATSSNVINTIVLRDGTGNFNANMISLSGATANPTDVATKSYVDSSVTTGSKQWIIRDVKATGTNGGTFTSGAWQTRILNDLSGNAGTEVTLASNQITVVAGTYILTANAIAYRVDGHKARLFNVTDNSVMSIGTSSTSGSGTNATSTYSIITNYFTLAATKVLRIEHQCITTRATDGFGVATNIVGASEVYTSLVIQKI